MKNMINSLPLMSALCFIAALFMPAAEAQSRQSELPADIIQAGDGIEAQIESEEEIVLVVTEDPLIRAEAIIINPQPNDSPPVVEHRELEIMDKTPEGWKIKVLLDAGDRKPGALIAVTATTATGATVASTVTPLAKEKSVVDPGNQRCQMENASARLELLLGLDEEKLSKVLEIRKRQKAALTGLLAKTLGPALFAKLNAAEKRVGLNYPQPISFEMRNEELAERLGTLQSLLKHGDIPSAAIAR